VAWRTIGSVSRLSSSKPVVLVSDAFAATTIAGWHRLGYFIGGTTFTIVAIVTMLITVIFVKEPKAIPIVEDEQYQGFRGFFFGLWDALRNRAFVCISLCYVTIWIAINLMQANLFFFYKFVLKSEELFTIQIFLLQVVAAGSLFAWAWVSSKIGKKVSVPPLYHQSPKPLTHYH
jgi:Na+/melibiose symporter-like transporter